jgi:hypothetical protein
MCAVSIEPVDHITVEGEIVPDEYSVSGSLFWLPVFVLVAGSILWVIWLQNMHENINIIFWFKKKVEDGVDTKMRYIQHIWN